MELGTHNTYDMQSQIDLTHHELFLLPTNNHHNHYRRIINHNIYIYNINVVFRLFDIGSGMTTMNRLLINHYSNNQYADNYIIWWGSSRWRGRWQLIQTASESFSDHCRYPVVFCTPYWPYVYIYIYLHTVHMYMYKPIHCYFHDFLPRECLSEGFF